MRQLNYISLLLLLLYCTAGCSDERTRLRHQNGNRQQDYREMLNRVRNHQTAQDSLNTIRNGIEEFQIQVGRLPTNLTEIVKLGYMPRIPEPPDGAAYIYDPVKGRIGLRRRQEATP